MLLLFCCFALFFPILLENFMWIMGCFACNGFWWIMWFSSTVQTYLESIQQYGDKRGQRLANCHKIWWNTFGKYKQQYGNNKQERTTPCNEFFCWCEVVKSHHFKQNMEVKHTNILKQRSTTNPFHQLSHIIGVDNCSLFLEFLVLY